VNARVPPTQGQGQQIPQKWEHSFKVTMLDVGYLVVGTVPGLVVNQQGNVQLEWLSASCADRAEVLETINDWFNKHSQLRPEGNVTSFPGPGGAGSGPPATG
jgi:hypothetical protein